MIKIIPDALKENMDEVKDRLINLFFYKIRFIANTNNVNFI